MSLTRRAFLHSSLLLTGGLLLGCTSNSLRILSSPKESTNELGLWLRIGTDNRIGFVVPSVEMGQGVTTSLPTILAEELDVEPERIAEVASKLEVPDDPPRKDRSQHRLVGQPLKRLDGLVKVTGQAQFGIDVKVPGMLYATVQQSPVFGGEVLRYDESTALNVK